MDAERELASGWTIAHLLCDIGFAAALDMLFTAYKFFDLNAPRGKPRLTPLMLAVRNGHVPCVQVLLQQPKLLPNKTDVSFVSVLVLPVILRVAGYQVVCLLCGGHGHAT